MPLARFRTPETLALFALLAALSVGVPWALGAGTTWIAISGVATMGLLFLPLAVKLQEWLLEKSLSQGDFARALRIATAVRDGASAPVSRALAEFDVGLVHLARGAAVDARLAFARIEKHRLKGPTRVLVQLYEALARLRAEGPAHAPALVALADEALASFGDDPLALAAKAEALLAAGDPAGARALLTQSIDLNPDPCDPSPGERYVLFARAALATGTPDEARKALQIVTKLTADGPFVRDARAELDRLGTNPAPS